MEEDEQIMFRGQEDEEGSEEGRLTVEHLEDLKRVSTNMTGWLHLGELINF